MPAILFWTWIEGYEMQPVSRIIEDMLKSANSDYLNKIKGTDVELTEAAVHAAFKAWKEKMPHYPLFIERLNFSLNDKYNLVLVKPREGTYGYMRIERPWGKGMRHVGREAIFSVEVSV